MPAQLIEFISHHWSLSLAFAFVSGLMLLNELWIKKQGPQGLTPSAAIEAMNHKKATVIDLRDVETFRAGHIIGAKNMPSASADDLKKYKEKPLILVCARGLQSSSLAVKLRKQDFQQVMVLTNGITPWKTDNLPLKKGKK
jgi:rhodanese-related sulfurtransferase